MRWDAYGTAGLVVLEVALLMQTASGQATCSWSPYTVTTLMTNADFNDLLGLASSASCSATINFATALTFTLTQPYTFQAPLTLDATATGDPTWLECPKLPRQPDLHPVEYILCLTLTHLPPQTGATIRAPAGNNMFTFTNNGRLNARNIRFQGPGAYTAGCSSGLILASTGNQLRDARFQGFYCESGAAVYLAQSASGVLRCLAAASWMLSSLLVVGGQFSQCPPRLNAAPR